jgi:hypothetical protein
MGGMHSGYLPVTVLDYSYSVDTPLPKGEWILELTTALSGFPYLGLTLLCPIRAD